ncbi:IS982 family transposase [Geobacillus stearothermophilus]|uniref:IS982 family transposase n=1 Tax=Geobacillus stearothermophilus TaxID=1422 RepID=UPI002E1B4CBD|nr:IS982 family transposase [Geobacillus stearothermophilus]MED4269599.1 IS982 family transposase [Geobacillus stearothermophilus]MED4298937.1 IS982 family transposase [Geobacillus stearothermophilus]
MNSSPLTTDRAKIQKQYAAIFFFVSAQLSSIQMYLQRRNRHLVKQEDAVVIAIHLLGKLLGFTSEQAWHRFVTGNLFTNGSFLERSRYNRRCRALGFAIKWIAGVSKTRPTSCYAVVDSLPLPLCHTARMHRVKRFQEIADIGYCASKQQWYYGLKLHLQVTDQGLPMGYVVTEASCHDRIATESVMTQIPHPYNFGDKGFISRELQKRLYEEYQMALWTPSRKNQKHCSSEAWEKWIQQKRKVIETVFSVLVDQYRITGIRANSMIGFEVALDGILLAYSLVTLGLVEF